MPTPIHIQHAGMSKKHMHACTHAHMHTQVDDLILSRKAVNEIFTGTVVSWDNPVILAENPGKRFPNDAIIRVARSDSSGTTEAFTRALYSFAGLSTKPPVDYSKHVLKGSALPDWPVARVPYVDGAKCTFKNCTKSVCSPGFFLDEDEDVCVECPKVNLVLVKVHSCNCMCMCVCVCVCV